MKPLWVILLLCLGATVCSRADDPVIMVDKDDAAMKAAFAKARSETDAFIAIMQSGAPSSCSIKVGITDHDQVEYFWLDNLTYAGGVFSGTIDNDPELVKNVKMGQKVSVKKEEIFDWLYMKDGKMYGNYTVRVLLPKMSKEDADKIKAVLAD